MTRNFYLSATASAPRYALPTDGRYRAKANKTRERKPGRQLFCFFCFAGAGRRRRHRFDFSSFPFSFSLSTPFHKSITHRSEGASRTARVGGDAEARISMDGSGAADDAGRRRRRRCRRNCRRRHAAADGRSAEHRLPVSLSLGCSRGRKGCVPWIRVRRAE